QQKVVLRCRAYCLPIENDSLSVAPDFRQPWQRSHRSWIQVARVYHSYFKPRLPEAMVGSIHRARAAIKSFRSARPEKATLPCQPSFYLEFEAIVYISV